MSDSEIKPEKQVKIAAGRSPAYPYIPLGKAVERVEQVYSAGVKDTPYPPATFYKVWEMGENSSGARQTMAALNHFELVSYDGRGDSRKVKLTPLALKIVRDKRPDSVDLRKAKQEAALKPAIFRRLYDHFPPPLPERVFVNHFLIDEAGYNESATDPLMRAYEATLKYSGLDLPPLLPDYEEEDATANEAGDVPQDLNIGDKVQWTINGVDQFSDLATVLGFSDDGEWVFTDKGKSGAKLSEVTKMPEQHFDTPPPVPDHIVAMQAQSARNANSVNDLAENQVILSQGKLKSGAFEVRVTGEIGAKEIGKIIQLLEAQKLILSDDD